MDRTTRRVFVSVTVLMLANLAVLHAGDAPASKRTGMNKPRSSFISTSDDAADKSVRRPNVLIIGASSLTSPVGQNQLVSAMLESKEIPVNIERRYPKLDAVSEMLGSKQVWDYVIMDAWHLGRAQSGQGGATVPPDFSRAVALFVKQVRTHSPNCKIILFPWWIPGGPKATNEGVMEVFHRCVAEAKVNNIWVATTGPAFMEARLDRPDLHIIKSKTDSHPGIHGAYINACSLFIVITGKSPVGLPAKLKITAPGGKEVDFTIAHDEARYLQELAWKIYRREIKNTKPAN